MASVQELDVFPVDDRRLVRGPELENLGWVDVQEIPVVFSGTPNSFVVIVDHV